MVKIYTLFQTKAAKRTISFGATQTYIEALRGMGGWCAVSLV